MSQNCQNYRQKFSDWCDVVLYQENNHDLPVDEAAAMGWVACKNAMIEILKENIVTEKVTNHFDGGLGNPVGSASWENRTIKNPDELIKKIAAEL